MSIAFSLDQLVDTLAHGEILPLTMATGLLLLIGQMAVANIPKAVQPGKKIALLMFIAYCVSQLSRDGIYEAETLLSIVLRGLIVGGMMLGASWIVLPALSFFSLPVGQTKRSIRNSWSESKRKKELKQQGRLEEERKRQEQEAWERGAPERRRKEIERQQAEQKRKEDQHKREEVRLRCQLLYDQNAKDLQESFPRERLAEYFEQYLSDTFSAEQVEHRAKLLQEMIEASLSGKDGPMQQFSSLNEIAAHFEEQRKNIALLGYDEQTQQSFLSLLNQQEDQLIREFLQR